MKNWLSEPVACQILPGRTARHEFMEPESRYEVSKTVARQDSFFEAGFTKFFVNFRIAACPACFACKPSRINLKKFSSRKRKKELDYRNQDLTIMRNHQDVLSHQHYDLFYRFKKHRFPHQTDIIDKKTFIESAFDKLAACQTWGLSDPTGKLVCGIIFNETPAALNLVQFYYDPDSMRRSLGIHAVHIMIDEARRKRKLYVYLGSATFEKSPYHYKTKFSGLEVLVDNRWQALGRNVVDQTGAPKPACK